MRTLIVGAGATGGYLGARLAQAGRDVTFLARARTRDRLRERGVEIRSADGVVVSTMVNVVTGEELSGTWDVVVLAVRSDAVARAIDDFAPAVGAGSMVIPVVNGMAHLDSLSARFGDDRVSGGAAQMITSLDNGVIQELRPGATIRIGRIGLGTTDLLAEVATLMTVDDVTTTVADDIVSVMWTKFAFIAATATLTCLLRSTIGPIARDPGGRRTAEAILDEIATVMGAKGYSLHQGSRTALHDTLTDPTSTFGPSMFRDLTGGRVVEASVLGELTSLAHDRGVPVPLLDAAEAGVLVHNAGVAAAPA